MQCGTFKYVYLLVVLASTRHDGDKQCAATDSEEETDNMPLEKSKPSEENEDSFG